MLYQEKDHTIDWSKSAVVDLIVSEEKKNIVDMCNFLNDEIKKGERFYFDHAIDILKDRGFDFEYTSTVLSIMMEMKVLKRYAMYKCEKCDELQHARIDYICRKCNHHNNKIEFNDLIFYFKK